MTALRDRGRRAAHGRRRVQRGDELEHARRRIPQRPSNRVARCHTFAVSTQDRLGIPVELGRRTAPGPPRSPRRRSRAPRGPSPTRRSASALARSSLGIAGARSRTGERLRADLEPTRGHEQLGRRAHQDGSAAVRRGRDERVRVRDRPLAADARAAGVERPSRLDLDRARQHHLPQLARADPLDGRRPPPPRIPRPTAWRSWTAANGSCRRRHPTARGRERPARRRSAPASISQGSPDRASGARRASAPASRRPSASLNGIGPTRDRRRAVAGASSTAAARSSPDPASAIASAVRGLVASRAARRGRAGHTEPLALEQERRPPVAGAGGQQVEGRRRASRSAPEAGRSRRSRRVSRRAAA